MQGYKNVIKNCMENAMMLSEGIKRMGRFDIVSKEYGVPLVAFSFKNKKDMHLAFKLSKLLRQYGWIVPAYTMPADADHVTVLRVVVREDFARPLVEKFLSHVEISLNELDSMTEAPAPTIWLTVELKPSENVDDEDGTFHIPSSVTMKKELVPINKSIPLMGVKTKGVC